MVYVIPCFFFVGLDLPLEDGISLFILSSRHNENIGHVLMEAVLPLWSSMIELSPEIYDRIPREDIVVNALMEREPDQNPKRSTHGNESTELLFFFFFTQKQNLSFIGLSKMEFF